MDPDFRVYRQRQGPEPMHEYHAQRTVPVLPRPAAMPRRAGGGTNFARGARTRIHLG